MSKNSWCYFSLVGYEDFMLFARFFVVIIISSFVLSFSSCRSESVVSKTSQQQKPALTFAQNLSLQDRLQWQERLALSVDCLWESSGRDDSQEKGGLQIWQLGSSDYLAEALCQLFPYMLQYRYRHIDTSKTPWQITPLLFQVYQDAQFYDDEEALFGFSSYDPEKKTLLMETKLRGLGDCIKTGLYKIEGRYTKLLEFRAKWECDGKVAPNPLPRVYPAN